MSRRLTPEERTHLRFLRTSVVVMATVWLIVTGATMGWPAMVFSLVFAALVGFAVYVHSTLRSLS